MTLTIVVVLLGAAFLHSAWHAMIKVSGDRLIGLAQIYRHGDLGLAYPIARGFSPLFATLIAIVALDEFPGAWNSAGILGMATSYGRISSESDPRLLLPAAAGTGLMVACYSVVDAYGSRLNGDWLGFTVWPMVLDGIAFVTFVSLKRGRVLWQTLARDWRITLISGLLGTGAFSAFFWALSRGPIGAVSALRETSVLFASLIGVAILKERWSTRRMIGVLLIAVGIGVFAFRG